jgi:GNAT superfamily N-acetyltransferase
MATRAKPRVAGTNDAARAAEILTGAFHNDPVWGWAFPDQRRRAAQHTAFWRFYVDAAIPYGWVWLSGDAEAVALWIPPGCPELPPEDEPRLEAMLIELVGVAQTAILTETFARFEAAHPREDLHYYLSLLGTHPDYWGHGIGMGLLADTLEMVDREGMPAYLESTNPANHRRYERLGFRHRGEFSLPGEGPRVATMWREAA